LASFPFEALTHFQTAPFFKFFYSNSMGMIRRSLWERHAFDGTLDTSEDYAWAIQQLDLGHICRCLSLPFRYSRSGHNRDYEFARTVFHLARKHRLKVTWLGLRATFKAWFKTLFQQDSVSALHRARLLAFCRVRLT
jgi:hypothetical protein